MDEEYPIYGTCTSFKHDAMSSAGKPEAGAAASSLGYTATVTGGRDGEDVNSTTTMFEPPPPQLSDESVKLIAELKPNNRKNGQLFIIPP